MQEYIIGIVALLGIGGLAYFVLKDDDKNETKNPLDFNGFAAGDDFYDGTKEPVINWDFGLDTKPVSDWVLNMFSGGGSNVNTNTTTYIELAEPLLTLIGQKESGGDYNAIFKNAKQVYLIGMTVKEVRNFQDIMVNQLKLKSSAVGKYQFIRKTFDGLVSRLNIPKTALFNPDLQDAMAYELLRQRGFEKFVTGRMSVATFARNLSMEWASFPKDASGVSYYAGDGLNKALISYSEVTTALNQVLNKARNSGIMS